MFSYMMIELKSSLLILQTAAEQNNVVLEAFNHNLWPSSADGVALSLLIIL